MGTSEGGRPWKPHQTHTKPMSQKNNFTICGRPAWFPRQGSGSGGCGFGPTAPIFFSITKMRPLPQAPKSQGANQAKVKGKPAKGQLRLDGNKHHIMRSLAGGTLHADFSHVWEGNSPNRTLPLNAKDAASASLKPQHRGSSVMCRSRSVSTTQ